MSDSHQKWVAAKVKGLKTREDFVKTIHKCILLDSDGWCEFEQKRCVYYPHEMDNYVGRHVGNFGHPFLCTVIPNIIDKKIKPEVLKGFVCAGG